MSFLMKIYYNDKPVILTTDSDAYIRANMAAQNYSLLKGASRDHYMFAIRNLEQSRIAGAIITDDDGSMLLQQLYAIYTPVDAAGGVVFNEHDAVLMIFRRGKWDLPKGKLDEGEQIDECALREVSEETGLRHLQLDGKLGDTYHIYSQHNQQLLKKTVWYRMRGIAADTLMPQKEENILDVRWIGRQDIAPFAARSYAAIQEVLQVAGIRW